MPIDLPPAGLAAIALAALFTYGLRAGGLLLAERLPKTPRLNRAMAALPGAILVSLVAPSIIAAGWWGCAAAGLTAFLAARKVNTFFAMAAGVVLMALARRFA